MSLIKKILLALLLVFVAMQFIRPAHNRGGQVMPTDITKTINVPGNIEYVFKKSCYDCHSNSTRYPWYVNIQPIGWMLSSHIKEGKANLNFSEFGTYSKRKQANKLRAIATSTKDGSMPIQSYTIMHANARLSKKNKALIIDWATTARVSIMEKD